MSIITEEQRNERVDELIQCVVCLSYFDDPRVAPCSHTFCLKCIKQIAATNQGTFLCPMRCDKVVRNNEIDQLTRNLVVRSLVELIMQTKGKIKKSTVLLLFYTKRNVSQKLVCLDF